MLVGASMAGAAGATVGAVLAALRNESMKFYAASMGSNFFLLPSTYIGAKEGGRADCSSFFVVLSVGRVRCRFRIDDQALCACSFVCDLE